MHLHACIHTCDYAHDLSHCNKSYISKNQQGKKIQGITTDFSWAMTTTI